MWRAGAILFIGVVLLGGCGEREVSSGRTIQSAQMALPRPDAPSPAEFPGLSNVVAYDENILSGSAPEGEEGFRTLAAMAVRTIISVDGAQPHVEGARAQGMRYVHLPIGYDGVSDDRRLELARAIRDLPGPIYIHCHHGKHRSAGAAGAALVSLGRISNEDAIARMEVSGTSHQYPGLYQCVARASIAAPDALDRASAEFPEQHRTTGMVQTMVEIERAFEHLKDIEAAGWVTPAAHPDLVPAAEAGRLADLLRNLPDDGDVQGGPEDLLLRMLDAAGDASTLEDGIIDGLSGAELSSRLKALDTSCRSCHAKYRDAIVMR